MRFNAIKIRLVLSSLLAVLAFSAVAASAAQAAAEGPFYKITGARLASGASKEVKGKTRKGEFFIGGNGAPEMWCSTAAFASGAKLLGSTGANFGSGEVTLEMSGCIIPAYHGCVVGEKGSFKTNPLKLELAYPEDARKGPIQAVLAETKKGFLNVKLTGGEACDYLEQLKLDGSVATEVKVGKLEELDEVGKEPVAAKTLELNFNRGGSRYVWLEKAGTLERFEVALFDSGDVYFDWSSELELASGAEWGIFT
jgi:hypothetical protein